MRDNAHGNERHTCQSTLLGWVGGVFHCGDKVTK